jgi:hypothetical protein
MAVAAAVSFGALGTPVAAAEPSTCADLSGVVDGAQICKIQATDPAYSIDISYPVNYPDQQAVFDFVKQTRDGFLNVAKAPGGHDMPYELDTKETEYSSSVPPRGTQSVVFQTFQDVGGAHPQTYYKTFSWDQVQRKPITVDTLFREGTQPFSVILPIVTSELTKQAGQPVDIPPSSGLDPKSYQNFAITNDALIFFFGQGELLPESAGAVQVSVPRAAVEAMLA